MECCYQYVYKITKLDKELCRLVIGHLIKDKFNKLKNKLQKMYDNRKYYITVFNDENDEIFKEIEFKNTLNCNMCFHIYDNLSVKNNVHYRIDATKYRIQIMSTSFRGIIMRIYELIYDDEPINSSIKTIDGCFLVKYNNS